MRSIERFQMPKGLITMDDEYWLDGKRKILGWGKGRGMKERIL